MRHVFPVTIATELGQSVTLFADGTARGDPTALELWLSSLGSGAEPPHHPGTTGAVMFWLLLRAMQDDKRIGRAPRS